MSLKNKVSQINTESEKLLEHIDQISNSKAKRQGSKYK